MYNSGGVVENLSANPLFTDLTTAKVIWLLVIAAFTLAVVIRGLRHKRRPDNDDPPTASPPENPYG